MKILEPSEGHLSNFEVLSHIQELRKKHRVESKVVSGNLATVMKEQFSEQLEDYLKESPASTQSEENVARLVESLAPYEFEKVELLMILNSRPKSETELDVLVEELEARLPDENQVQDVLDKVRQYLGGDEEAEQEDADGNVADIEMDGADGG